MISGDAVEAIQDLKQRSGKDMIIWGSISLTHELMKADLIDLYKIRICATIVGGGRPLFPKGEHYRQLKLVEHADHRNGLISASFTVE